MNIIKTTEELASFCESIANKYIAIDTEFVRERTYFPELCLIQLATPTQLALVDTLAEGLSLEPFFTLLKNENVVKVIHSGRQDIEIFWHLGKCIPTPVFDTQIAVLALGFADNLSYSAMVKHFLDKNVDKSQQYTNWGKRPLSSAQLEYAAADVVHLCAIYEKMLAEIEKRGRIGWLDDLHAWLGNPDIYEVKPEDAWKKLYKDKMSGRSVLALKHLAAWREEQAINRNLTRRFIMPDEAVQSVASFLPKDEEALNNVRVARSISPMARKASIAAVKYALQASDSEVPKASQRLRNQVSSALLSLLSMLLKARAEHENVAPELIATREDLENFLKQQESSINSGWRYEIFGKYATELLSGKLSLHVENGNITFSQKS